MKKKGELEMKWNNKYELRIRISFSNGFSFTPYSNIVIFETISQIKFKSKIITKEEENILLSFLPKGKQSKVTLLYRGSRDGFAANDFHSKCNGKGATVTIVLSDGFKHVFGGFTNVAWNSVNN